MSISLVGSMEHPSCALWSGFARWFRILRFVRLVRGLTALCELVIGVSKREERRTENPKSWAFPWLPCVLTACCSDIDVFWNLDACRSRLDLSSCCRLANRDKDIVSAHNVKSASHE